MAHEITGPGAALPRMEGKQRGRWGWGPPLWELGSCMEPAAPAPRGCLGAVGAPLMVLWWARGWEPFPSPLVPSSVPGAPPAAEMHAPQLGWSPPQRFTSFPISYLFLANLFPKLLMLLVLVLPLLA